MAKLEEQAAMSNSRSDTGGLGQRSLITDGQPVVLEIAVTEANAPEGFVYDRKLRPR